MEGKTNIVLSLMQYYYIMHFTGGNNLMAKSWLWTGSQAYYTWVTYKMSLCEQKAIIVFIMCANNIK